MKTKQEQIEKMMLDVPQTIAAYDANPNSPWFSNSMFSKKSGRDFDALVNEFTYYNCNTSELGRRPAFYAITINE